MKVCQPVMFQPSLSWLANCRSRRSTCTPSAGTRIKRTAGRASFLAQEEEQDHAAFPKWLEEKDEPELDLDTTNFTHFDTYVQATKTTVKLTKSPDRLVFGAAKGAANWL